MSGVGFLVYRVSARAEQVRAEAQSRRQRHNLRNRLGSIRNAAFFLSRKLHPDWKQSEPRLPEFLELIQSEVALAEELLKRPSDSLCDFEVSTEVAVALALFALGLEPACTPSCIPNQATIDLAAALCLLADVEVRHPVSVEQAGTTVRLLVRSQHAEDSFEVEGARYLFDLLGAETTRGERGLTITLAEAACRAQREY
ncbi:MAG: hypothetical protein H6718_22900 [Polyangiaceae bacterium]|nr:hypothetical protein [Polyangiaceae bacterium]